MTDLYNAMPELPATGADSVVWDLSDMYPAPDSNIFQKDFDNVESMASAFRTKWYNTFTTLAPNQFAAMLQEYERCWEVAAKINAYCQLLWTTDTQNKLFGALMQKAHEKVNSVGQRLSFVPVQWKELSQETVADLYSAPELKLYRYWMDKLDRQKRHILSETEENLLAEKSLTGQFAWIRFFEEVVGSTSFEFDGKELNLQGILALLQNRDRDVRRIGSDAFYAGLRKHAHAVTFVYNTILADCASEDKLRGHDSWVDARNLSNDISNNIVNNLVTAVTNQYGIVNRYYNLKKSLLGLDVMHNWDRQAPLTFSKNHFTWADAREIVQNSYANFDENFGAIVREFFEKNWIHAAVGNGKRNGAYASPTVPSVHPYIFMNYAGTPRDVQTLAHELGHGIHQYLSRRQGMLNFDTPLTLAETASIFGEMLVFTELYNNAKDNQEKLALLVEWLDDTMSTVFRQIAFNRFENEIHTARRSTGELTTEQLTEHWMKTQRDMYGDSVTLNANYEFGWMYIGHFMRTPGYVYAYAFGKLLVIALFRRYQEEGDSFVQKYSNLLAAGGSDEPGKLLSSLGIDLSSSALWNDSLEWINSRISLAENLAEQI